MRSKKAVLWVLMIALAAGCKRPGDELTYGSFVASFNEVSAVSGVNDTLAEPGNVTWVRGSGSVDDQRAKISLSFSRATDAIGCRESVLKAQKEGLSLQIAGEGWVYREYDPRPLPMIAWCAQPGIAPESGSGTAAPAVPNGGGETSPPTTDPANPRIPECIPIDPPQAQTVVRIDADKLTQCSVGGRKTAP